MMLQMHGTFREMFTYTPGGDYILVGRNIAPELKELRLTEFTLIGVGTMILLLGLAGGWWIATRAMRPIQDISGTTVRIAAGDLSHRIKSSDTESELGQLASVLNSTFSRLETSFDQQQQFTADAAHELRTPVSVMITETQTALNRERNASEYRETLEVCQRAAQRMRRLIESLLELARLDAGQETMKRLQFDLSAAIRDCVELIQPLANERGIKLHYDLQTLECVGDPEHLRQVVTNLLTNAVNYSKDNGEVGIHLHRQNGMAVMTVTDTGVGIPTEHLPHIFERFYRADPSRSSGHAGLGLAISKAIVEAHGGTIEVASQQGAGSTFTVRLPTTGRH
jgi:heavy metal sensor kinase